MSNQAPPTPKQPHESTETLSLTGDLDLEKQLQDNSSAGTVAEPTTSTTEKSAAGPHVLSLNDAESESGDLFTSRSLFFHASWRPLTRLDRCDMTLMTLSLQIHAIGRLLEKSSTT